MFCDLVGSTSLADAMDPEDWTDIVNETVADMAACVERYEGTVAQFAGDSILALFGAPVAHEDDPYRAIRAGLDIIEGVRTLARTFRREQGINVKVRVGCHTGLVIVGDVEAGDLNLYTALGDTTNVAARVQAEARPGTLVISEDTYLLVTGDVEVEDLGPFEMKGKPAPVGLFEVVEARDVNTRRRGIPGLVSPMVGRSDQLTELVSLTTEAGEGAGRVAVIVGEPGVGKSRLVSELGTKVATIAETRWVVGRCASFDQQRPYRLVESLVLALAGVTEAEDDETRTSAVAKMAADAYGPYQPAQRHLLQMIGLAEGSPDDDPGVLHGHYETAVARLLVAESAGRHPLVLVCEDIHWADPSSSELLSSVLARLAQVPVLLVLVTRPDHDAHGWHIVQQAHRDLGTHLVQTDLVPLDGEDSRQLVANLLEIESLPSALRELVLDKADGNPFFLEEVVRMLVDRDMIELQDGHWVASEEITTLEVPGTLHGLVASRVDLLDPEVQATARLASVIGRRFDSGLFEAVAMSLDPRGDRFLTDVFELEQHGLVKAVATRPEATFAFRHALTHDVIYSTILKRERRELHLAVGRIMERLYADRLQEVAPALARHFTEANDWDKALRYLLAAGRTAQARHALVEAHGFFSEALELIEKSDTISAELRIEAVLSKARAGVSFTPADQSMALIDTVLQDAIDSGDPDLLARVYSLSLLVRSYMEENYLDAEYRAVMDAAYALAPRVTDPGLRYSLESIMGQVLRAADKYQAGFELMATAGPNLEAAGRLSEASYNATFAADSLASMGRLDEAEEWIARALDLSDQSGNLNAMADAYLVRGRIASTRGDLEEALEHTRRGLETAESTGNIACALVGNFLVADQQLRMGQPAAAIPFLEKTSELGEYCRSEVYVALGDAWLASANARLGNLDAAGYAEPLRTAQQTGTRSGEALVRLHRAVALAGAPQPDWEASFADFEMALELFDQIGARPDQARVLHAYGMALEAAGRPEGSSERLSQALTMFEEMGITPDPVLA